MMSWLWGGATASAESPTSNSSNPPPTQLHLHSSFAGGMMANHHHKTATEFAASAPTTTTAGMTRNPSSYQSYPLSNSPSPLASAAGYGGPQLTSSFSPSNAQMTATTAVGFMIPGSNAPTPVYGQGRPHPFPLGAISSSSSSTSALPPVVANSASGFTSSNTNIASTLTPSQSNLRQSPLPPTSQTNMYNAARPNNKDDDCVVSELTRERGGAHRTTNTNDECGSPSAGAKWPNVPSRLASSSVAAPAPSSSAVAGVRATSLPQSRYTDVSRLAKIISSLIDFQPIPKLMEAAVLVGKVRYLLRAEEEARLLDNKRFVDELLEEAIDHRDAKNRLVRAAAERDALVDLVTRHPLISYTPSVTEERTASISGIVTEVKAWVDAQKGGLEGLLLPTECESDDGLSGKAPSGQDFPSSLSKVNELEKRLMRAASLLEVEVGAVYGPPPTATPKGHPSAISKPQDGMDNATKGKDQMPLPTDALSFILLSSLLIDISRAAIATLTTYIVPDDENKGNDTLSPSSLSTANGARAPPTLAPAATSSANPLSSSSPTLLTTSAWSPHASSRAVMAAAAAPATNTTTPPPMHSYRHSSAGGVLLPPAKANKVFFRSDANGVAIADSFRELMLVAKSICGSGLVCEAVQTVCSIRLAELMSAIDDTIPMEGVVRRRRTNTLSNASCAGTSQRGYSVSNASFNSSALPTPSSVAVSGGLTLHSGSGGWGGGGNVTRAASGASGHHHVHVQSSHGTASGRMVSPSSGGGGAGVGVTGPGQSTAIPSPCSTVHTHDRSSTCAADGEGPIELYCEISGVRIPPAYAVCYHADLCYPFVSEGASAQSTPLPPWYALVSQNPLLGSLLVPPSFVEKEGEGHASSASAAAPAVEESCRPSVAVVHPFVADYLAQIVGPA